MPEDFFLIDIPVFVPKYEEVKRYGWTKYKDNLWNLLNDTTGGYCMYCYDTIVINRQRRGQIEHGIERANSPEGLTDCIPNLGLACELCNDKYKRRGEVTRRLPDESIENFVKGNCLRFDCKGICEKYETLRQEYVKKGKLILQPFGVKCSNKGNILKLQYDLLKCCYIPCQSRPYSEEEKNIIWTHIELFRLNHSERKNYELGRYCKNVIDNNSVMKDVIYNNLIVDLFRNKLEILQVEEAVKICKIVYSNAFFRLAT